MIDLHIFYTEMDKRIKLIISVESMILHVGTTDLMIDLQKKYAIEY
jgi:hypothetical protein